MKITKLSIENFKKFKDRTEFEFLDQNFFVGENNTGKTSVKKRKLSSRVKKLKLNLTNQKSYAGVKNVNNSRTRQGKTPLLM